MIVDESEARINCHAIEIKSTLITRAHSGMSLNLPAVFLVIFCVAIVHENLCTHINLVSLCKNGAVLGMCLLFKTVVSSYRSNNTHLRY